MISTWPTIPAWAREPHAYCRAIDGLAPTNVSQTGYFREFGLESNIQMAVGSSFASSGPCSEIPIYPRLEGFPVLRVPAFAGLGNDELAALPFFQRVPDGENEAGGDERAGGNGSTF